MDRRLVFQCTDKFVHFILNFWVKSKYVVVIFIAVVVAVAVVVAIHAVAVAVDVDVAAISRTMS